MINNDTLISEDFLQRIKPLHSLLLKATIWIFIAGVVTGATLILIGDESLSEIITKVMGTLFILATMSIVSAINFKRLEKHRVEVQAFAILGLITNVAWALLWILACWSVFDIWTYKNYSCGYGYSDTSSDPCRSITGFSVLGTITFIITFLSSLSFLSSNILSIKDNYNKSVVLPAKITAVVCLIYETAFFSALVISYGSIDDRFGALAGFAGLIWTVSTLIALIISAIHPKKTPAPQPTPTSQTTPDPVPTPPTPTAPPRKTDDELRAEIEERVRAEMIEKEVRAKLAAEMQQDANTQTDNQSPDVT